MLEQDSSQFVVLRSSWRMLEQDSSQFVVFRASAMVWQSSRVKTSRSWERMVSSIFSWMVLVELVMVAWRKDSFLERGMMSVFIVLLVVGGFLHYLYKILGNFFYNFVATSSKTQL